jgi:hypothetical protein
MLIVQGDFHGRKADTPGFRLEYRRTSRIHVRFECLCARDAVTPHNPFPKLKSQELGAPFVVDLCLRKHQTEVSNDISQ